MPSRFGSTIIKLLVVSLIVGFVIAKFSISPRELLGKLGETVQAIFQIGVDFIQWGAQYILIGAVVVVPIWLVMLGWRAMRGKGGGRHS